MRKPSYSGRASGRFASPRCPFRGSGLCCGFHTFLSADARLRPPISGRRFRGSKGSHGGDDRFGWPEILHKVLRLSEQLTPLLRGYLWLWPREALRPSHACDVGQAGSCRKQLSAKICGAPGFRPPGGHGSWRPKSAGARPLAVGRTFPGEPSACLTRLIFVGTGVVP